MGGGVVASGVFWWGLVKLVQFVLGYGTQSFLSFILKLAVWVGGAAYVNTLVY